MSTLGNFLWFVFGGLVIGLVLFILGAVAFVTVIGIPWGRACFVLGNFAFFPFGREVISRKTLNQSKDIGTGIFGSLGNIVWLLVAGWWLALIQVLLGLISCITIIGIPFGVQWFKLAGAALLPVGKTVVSKEVASASLKANAEALVSKNSEET